MNKIIRCLFLLFFALFICTFAEGNDCENRYVYNTNQAKPLSFTKDEIFIKDVIYRDFSNLVNEIAVRRTDNLSNSIIRKLYKSKILFHNIYERYCDIEIPIFINITFDNDIWTYHHQKPIYYYIYTLRKIRV